jgi:uncharacterized membrane protein
VPSSGALEDQQVVTFPHFCWTCPAAATHLHLLSRSRNLSMHRSVVISLSTHRPVVSSYIISDDGR